MFENVKVNIVERIMKQHKRLFRALLSISLTLAAVDAMAELTFHDRIDGSIYVTLDGRGGLGTEPGNGTYKGINFSFGFNELMANVPLQEVTVCNDANNSIDSLYLEKLKPFEALVKFTVDISRNRNCKSLHFGLQDNFYPKKIKFINASHNDRVYIKSFITLGTSLHLAQDLSMATTNVAYKLQDALANLKQFKEGLKKTDRPNRTLARLISAIEGTLRLIADDKGEPKYLVTHVVIQEQMRKIMVLATVMNEMFADYDEVPTVKDSVAALKSLALDIRGTYGWDDGFVGAASKSLAALGMLVSLELEELYEFLNAAGIKNYDAINRVIIQSNRMDLKTEAYNAGDARAQEFVISLSNEWNKAEFQAILLQLLNAPKDYQNIVLPKLKLLLTAVERLSELTNVNLLIPDDVKAMRRQAKQGQTQQPLDMQKN